MGHRHVRPPPSPSVTRTHLRVLASLLARHAAELPDDTLRDPRRHDDLRLLAWATSAAVLAATALTETDPAQAARTHQQLRTTLAEAHALAWHPHA